MSECPFSRGKAAPSLTTLTTLNYIQINNRMLSNDQVDRAKWLPSSLSATVGNHTKCPFLHTGVDSLDLMLIEGGLLV